MKLLRSKSWYEKKAKSEPDCSIAAGRFPSEVLDTKTNLKVVSKSKSGKDADAKLPAVAHRVRHSK